MSRVIIDLYSNSFVIYAESFADFKLRRYDELDGYPFEPYELPKTIKKGDQKRLLGILVHLNYGTREYKCYNPLYHLRLGDCFIFPCIFISRSSENSLYSTEMDLDVLKKDIKNNKLGIYPLSLKYLKRFIKCIEIK